MPAAGAAEDAISGAEISEGVRTEAGESCEQQHCMRMQSIQTLGPEESLFMYCDIHLSACCCEEIARTATWLSSV
jgi:hypothetical protein